GTEQVTRGNAVARTQRGTAAGAAFGQRHRRTALAVTAALWTIRTLTRTTGWHQRLFLFHFGQGKRLTVGSLAQQRSGQGTRAATDIGNQLVEQLAMAGFGIGHQRCEAVGEFLDARVQHMLGLGLAHLGDLLVVYSLY